MGAATAGFANAGKLEAGVAPLIIKRCLPSVRKAPRRQQGIPSRPVLRLLIKAAGGKNKKHLVEQIVSLIFRMGVGETGF